MRLKNLIKSKTRILILIFVLTLVFNTSFRTIFFSSSKEIIYDYKTTMLFCTESHKCSYFGNLSLANTGSQTLNNIKISISNLPKSVRSSVSTLNLSSAEPRSNDPLIKDNYSEFNRIISINDLSPGALVDIEFSGRAVSNEYKPTLQEASASVLADAKIYNASPRGTKISRLFSMLLWF